ncbi:MAG: hypothetical protein KME60_03270 [Cyanomargarita calcarea GSE-NOS-MK-12-04C]|jgi:hypothetical protein|uniref:Uncharacterized protein n=1 Tax=Cyanomargarita calcarea GSE-NOS-MK-12-04C TaxID=2839659 RepID=A0A951URN9_9CYAN|nr:hypothetical protein [Cyanomargarita calcarea GSE-NOS-MK-12-04C]
MLLKSSQIAALFDGFIRINNFNANANSSNITTAITTPLATAGRGGVSVPLQAATNTTIGVVTTGTTVALFLASSEKPALDNAGNKVYGRLTESSGVYTLNYFSNVAGVETAYTFASTTIDFVIPYRFDFARLPSDFAIAFPINDINIAAGGGVVARQFSEKLTVTATNTLSNLTFTPNFDYNISVEINGKVENSFGGGSASFSRNVKTLIWNQANAGYQILTTDDVVARYTTLE